MCFVHAKNTDSTCAEEKMKECIHFFKVKLGHTGVEGIPVNFYFYDMHIKIILVSRFSHPENLPVLLVFFLFK